MRSLRLLVFDLYGKVGHFRRPDTTGTHATYPFIPRTTLQGLIASILGHERLTGENWLGIQLLRPIKTCAQEMSMLGKGWLGEARSTFNRPTSIELVVNPGYRIYYAGDHTVKLRDMLREGRSRYHTYLGSAYCLTFPRFVDYAKAEDWKPPRGLSFECRTVVPSHIIERLYPADGVQYGRVGGMHYEYLGERRFRDTVNIIYEVNGKPMTMQARDGLTENKPCRLCRLSGGGVVCLW